MNDIMEYEVEIEYGEKELVDCLSNLLILMNENCENKDSEIENK